ncbi:uncharacterized protein EI97DRAFT_127262 [Westerdykella ornata]|uniref:Uncharacterized protein n=1 Tax=Westerdykella ornata TaxID=318751 RepID=A0A6A6JCS2_WESOR|nr:uncharacterized protein EI97DRAFT_127262 [Westerdykella ornata]KAF2274361.1 hypothetical protein EI97DRAFT_127262 [Westerdykella ornata]
MSRRTEENQEQSASLLPPQLDPRPLLLRVYQQDMSWRYADLRTSSVDPDMHSATRVKPGLSSTIVSSGPSRQKVPHAVTVAIRNEQHLWTLRVDLERWRITLRKVGHKADDIT